MTRDKKCVSDQDPIAMMVRSRITESERSDTNRDLLALRHAKKLGKIGWYLLKDFEGSASTTIIS